jgi:hypothetical protein
MKRSLVTHLLAALVAGGLVYAVIAHKTPKKPSRQVSLDFKVLHEGGLILRDVKDRNQTAVIHSDEGRAQFKKDYPAVELRTGPEVLAKQLLIVVFSDSLSGITVDRFWEASPCHYALDVRLLLTERRIGPPPAGKKYSCYCAVAVDRSHPIANVGLRQATEGLCRQYGGGKCLASDWTLQDAMKARGKAKDGRPYNGFFYEWWTTDQKALLTYKNGKLHGIAIAWHAGGKRRWEGAHHNGACSGTWSHWDEQGKLVARGAYKDGQPWEGTFLLSHQPLVTYKRGVRYEPTISSGPSVNRLLQAALETVIDFYAAGDARGLAGVVSGPKRRLMWAAKDPDDPKRVAQMKKFGGQMKKIEPRWRVPAKGIAIASFGSESKAYHFRFVRKKGAWLLDDVNGGD